jgi:hypothetical protein
MLVALGAFLQVLNLPLNAMGVGMMMNSAAYAAAMPGGDAAPMSTVAFNVFAGPWIQYLGNLAVAAGNLMVSLNTFLINLANALTT